jgi:hypothetical protein
VWPQRMQRYQAVFFSAMLPRYAVSDGQTGL